VVLKDINELSIKFEDIQTWCLTAQLDSHAIQQRRLGTNNPYPAELQNVCHALRELPNIRTLTVKGPLIGRGFAPPVGYLNQLFTWIGNNLRQIEELAIYVPVDMNLLLIFNNLRRLSFSGFSIAETDKFKAILQQLPFLETLEIACVEQRDPQIRQWQITSSDIQSIKPLKTLVLRELYSWDHPDHHGMIFSKDICAAFEKRHSSTLEHLVVTSNYMSGRFRLAPLKSLIRSATSLKTLTLKRWHFEPTVLGKLSSKLESLDITAGSQSLGVEKFYLDTLHTRLPLLRDIRFKLTPIQQIRSTIRGQTNLRLLEIYRYESSDFGRSKSEKWADGWPKGVGKGLHVTADGSGMIVAEDG
jgi:hypothetical protein